MFVLLCCASVLLQIAYCMRIDNVVREWDSVKNNTEIRCYCNLPACITTSYMCKSEGLGCFSDIQAFSDVNRASHGCLDLLESERQDQCQNEPSSRSVSHPRSLLLCCYRDLCNHVDSPETRQRYNDSVLASSLVNDGDRSSVMMVNSRLRQTPGYTSAEVWFRAATIAVPICGALILFVLIALAVRILQSDAMDDRMIAAKLRAKHSGFSPVSLNGPNFVHQLHDHTRNDSLGGKKLPLLFHHDTANPAMSSVPLMSCVNRPTSHGQGVNVLHSCHQQHKNQANAKLNLSHGTEAVGTVPIVPVVPVHTTTTQTEPPSNLIDLHKSTSTCNNNCNIYQHEESPEDLHPACSLLSSVPSNDKLTYKKPLVTAWTASDIKAPNFQ